MVCLAWISIFSGCSSAIKFQVSPGAKPRPTQAVAVYPFQFRWSEPAFRSFELGQRLALQVAASERYAVFGPGEFQVRDEARNNVLSATDLATTVSGEGQSVASLVVLRGWAEKQEQVSVNTLTDASGKAAGQRAGMELTLIAHLELLDPVAGEILAEAEGKVQPDLLAPQRDDDPAPELTKLVEQLGTRMLSAMDDLAPGESIERKGWGRYHWSAAEMFQFSEQGRPSLDKQLGTLDPVSREVAHVEKVRFFAADLDESKLTALSKLPGGLWMEQVEPEAAAKGLQPDDLLIEIANGPATPLRLSRVLRAAHVGDSVTVAVRRGAGERVPLSLPAQ
jgi:hypothetical protein